LKIVGTNAEAGTDGREPNVHDRSVDECQARRQDRCCDDEGGVSGVVDVLRQPDSIGVAGRLQGRSHGEILRETLKKTKLGGLSNFAQLHSSALF
jgi:hypothetical protein